MKQPTKEELAAASSVVILKFVAAKDGRAAMPEEIARAGQLEQLRWTERRGAAPLESRRTHLEALERGRHVQGRDDPCNVPRRSASRQHLAYAAMSAEEMKNRVEIPAARPKFIRLCASNGAIPGPELNSKNITPFTRSLWFANRHAAILPGGHYQSRFRRFLSR